MPRRPASKRSEPHAPLHVVILAAGQGTRMKSAIPKVLHVLGGRTLVAHVLDTAQALGAEACHVVLGHGAETVRAWFAAARPGDESVVFVHQAQQLGTGHAVQQAMPNIPDNANVLVLYGDVPLIERETLSELVEANGKGLAILTARVADPTGYGRIVRDKSGAVKAIVEHKDASSAQLRIGEINTGVMAAPARKLRDWLARVGNRNAKHEYYLTDCVALAVKDRASVKAVVAESSEEVLGVNDRVQLAQQERTWQRRQAEGMMKSGVGIRDPARFDLRGTLLCGTDVTIDVGVIIEGEVHLGDHVTIGPHTVLRNVRIGAGTHVEAHCVLDSAEIGRACRIGPFARIRPESRLGDQVHIGNFVELKKSSLADGSKANHLAYVGDATVGSRVNIGAGVITCNYDGANKHRTIIGDDAFIGTDTQLIAPVTIGEGAYIAAGSSISMDAPARQLTICRARDQRSLPGWKRPKKAGTS